MNKVVIVAAVRTPISTFNGSFANTSAIELGRITVESALKRAKIDASIVDEVIFGNVLQAGLGQNPARQIAMAANIPDFVPAFTVNKVCGSGLKAIQLAAQAIAVGDSEVVVAGGAENMSQAPFLLPNSRWGMRMGNQEIVDTIIHDGLTDVFTNQHMGMTAEILVDKFKMTRQELDKYALLSQSRAEEAIKSGRFTDEIVPVQVKQKRQTLEVSEDEHPRFGLKLEDLERLKPAFKENGSVTAGNSSGINDGAAALILMSEAKAKELNLDILAIVASSASAGVKPELMGVGPIPSTKKALDKVNWEIEDIDLIEINESFAAQTLSVVSELNLDIDKVNVNGGAIALGHPIGASGARIVVSLLHEMKKRESKKGLATLCIGGGQGITMLLEMP